MTPRQQHYATAVRRARLANSINATTTRLLLELNRHPDHGRDNHTVWPGETRLLRLVHTSRRMLQYAKREAERKGWATIVQPEAGKSCRYTLLIPVTGAITPQRTGAMDVVITPQATGAIHCTQVKHLDSRSTPTAASKNNKPLTSSLQQPKQVSGKPVSSKELSSKEVSSEPVSSKEVSSKPVSSKPVSSKPVSGKQLGSRELVWEVDPQVKLDAAVRGGIKADAVQNPAGFALVWEVYPRKVKLDAAVRAWDQLAPDDALVNAMLDAIAAQSRSRQWKDPDFIPFLCNWLDGHRWEDEVRAVLPLSTKGQANLAAAQDWIGRRRAAAVTVEAAVENPDLVGAAS